MPITPDYRAAIIEQDRVYRAVLKAVQHANRVLDEFLPVMDVAGLAALEAAAQKLDQEVAAAAVCFRLPRAQPTVIGPTAINWRDGIDYGTARKWDGIIALAPELLSIVTADPSSTTLDPDRLQAASKRLKSEIGWLESHLGSMNESLEIREILLMAEMMRKRGVVEAGPGTGDSRPGAAHSPDFRSVRWGEAEFTFTEMQAACVKVLWANWKQGTPDVADQTVLNAVEGFQTRLDHVFDKGKHPAWGTMIVPGETRGTRRLSDPDSAGT